MAMTHTPSSAGRGAGHGATRGVGQVGIHQTRIQAAPQSEVGNMGQPQAAMPDQVQGQGVQDVPPPVPTVALHADGGSLAPQATLQTQAPAQTPTFGNKEVSLQEFMKLKSPKFTGSDNSADPQSFLDGTLKALRALGCSSERAVELATYKLEDMANIWYETVLLGRPVGAAPLTWDEFTKLFMNHFLPDSLMQKYAMPTEESRVQRFVDGLVGRLYTTVAPQIKTLSYSDAVDLAKKIETKGREDRTASDLRKKAKIRGPHYRQGNIGPLSSGHHNSGQIYATTPVCQTCGRSHLGQCRILIGECFRCGQLGHHLRDCPRPLRNFNQDSIQSGVPTQTTRNTSGATSTENRGRGAGDCATVNQGQGNAGRGILSVCSFDALALIDPGSTHSYVSSYFALRFSRQSELFNNPFLVATPVGESLLAEYVYRACQIRVEGRDTLANLIVLDIIDFDMLMGMDWLSSCYAIVDCHAKIVKFEIPNEPSFVLKGGQVPENCKFVSFMKAQ
ncbi:uncharacterized protein LOC142180156 [Nicotiana tabacum]|uniref:Uncharacterized protein LOC142180156 n=1 Tax=Nicotiana tabacum TaxID=4097 RepID=A0AC58UCI5_TOBAC